MSMHFDVVSKAQQFRPLFNKKRPARQQHSVFSTLNEKNVSGNFQRYEHFAMTILAIERLQRVGNSVIGCKHGHRRAIERIFSISF